MTLFIHNLKVAIRNLMKYKLQTLISVLSIAVGIVTLALTHSALENFQLPPICQEDYYPRTYSVYLKPTEGTDRIHINHEIITALKGNGGLIHAEKTVFTPVEWSYNKDVEFQLLDSTVRKGSVDGIEIDPEYPEYAGLRSAITGKRIRRLNPGEAIVSEDFVSKVFHGHNPIGAVQVRTGQNQPIPVTIVDVFRRVPLNFRSIQNQMMYFSTQKEIEDLREINVARIETILKETSTQAQLLDELNGRLKPLGLKAEIRKQSDFDNSKAITTIRSLAYLIGCLILLAAMIGFLRIQIQMVWMRRREMSLRVVNGATKSKLFQLLILETSICIFMSVAVAVLLGVILQDFLTERLDVFILLSGVRISDLWTYSLLTGGLLLVISVGIIYFILLRIFGKQSSLSARMRGSKNHFFRNVMLGIQMAICLVFICVSFLLIDCGNKVLRSPLIPRNDNLYKESLYIASSLSEGHHSLIEEISRMKELDKLISLSNMYFPYREIQENEEIKEKLNGRTNFNTYCTPDTSLLLPLGIEVEWLKTEIDRTECLLLHRKLYDRLKAMGAIDGNSLTMDIYTENYSGLTLPIAGVFDNIPYQNNDEVLLAISPRLDQRMFDRIAIPKPGKGPALKRKVMEAAERLKPEEIDMGITNFRQKSNIIPDFMETAMSLGWILGSVSLIICIMGIFSTITLDTRTRQKEVAIRKVNGAKSHDIYLMFGKMYVWLILASMIIAVPLSVTCGKGMNTVLLDLDLGIETSPVGPILLGCLLVIALIFAIVFWQIHRVMQIDPAKIIAKE